MFLKSLMAVIVALLGHGVGPSVVRGATERSFSIDHQRDILLRPSHPNGRLVIYVHGASGSAEAINEPPVLALTKELLRHGFSVAASDAHGPQNWGDPGSVADYVRLDHKLGFRHVVLLAQSMGGLDGLELIDRIHPEAWAGIYPVCNAQSSYESEYLKPYVEEAWPGPPPHSLSPVEPQDVAGLPVIIWASPEDTVVSFKDNAALCTTRLREHGAHVQLVKTVGDHGDPSNFHRRRLNQFFERWSGLEE